MMFFYGLLLVLSHVALSVVGANLCLSYQAWKNTPEDIWVMFMETKDLRMIEPYHWNQWTMLLVWFVGIFIVEAYFAFVVFV